MRRVLFIWLSLLLSLTVCFAAPSTEGREFWLTFMRNIRPCELSLFVSARQNATVTVENPNTHWSTSFAVIPGQTATCTIPREQGYIASDGQGEAKGIRVTSTADISLFASNYADYTYDATLILPITALGNKYIVQTWEDNEETAEMAIVAITSTTVTITPHARTKDGHVKNVSYDVQLQAGEVIQVQKADEYSDFSGTHIYSDKPIAVFAGHACARVPESNKWCDHLVEQQRPTSYWGTQFALVKTLGQQGNRVMLTARDNNTIVRLNGTQVTTLNALESYAFRLTDNSAYVQTSEPAACFLYPEGAHDNGLYGDPSSVTIHPFEQRIKDITFATFHTRQSASNFVNIVTTNLGAQSMTLDGKSVSAAFAPLAGTNGMQFAQIPVSQGTHTLHTSEDGFVGYVYGLGYCESYAYSLGAANYSFYPEKDDGTPLEYLYKEIAYTDAQCYRNSITFTARTNIDYSSIEWNFGDGATGSGLTATHTYAAPGAYTVTMTIHTATYQSSTTETILLSDMFRDTIHADLCEGEQYIAEGQTFTQTGVYTLKQSATETCDSLVVLDLTVHPKYFISETASFPKGSSYAWHERRYRQPGVYKDSLLSVYGCDSVYELHLTQTDEEEEMYDTICYQPIYTFHGYDFPLPSVDGYEDRTFINYTLCYADKIHCKTYRIHLAIVPREGGEYAVYDTISAGQTYTWFDDTYTQEGSYRKVIGDQACQEIYTLHLTVLPFPIEETNAAFCHEDTIHWRDKSYTAPGVYADTAFSMWGIEGIYQLRISDQRTYSELSVQNVSEYDFHGRILTESGSYRDTLTNAAGCDSVVTLYLGIMEPCRIMVEEHQGVCEGSSIEWNGQICEPGNEYTASFVSSGGCDSIVTLHLSTLEKKTQTLQVALCQGDYYLLNETKYTDEGDYSIPLIATNGCDSLLTLQLRYKPLLTDTTDTIITMVESYRWQGETYAESGEWTKGFVASDGCDSIEVLRLTVLPCRHTSETLYDTILSGQTMPFEDANYTETGVYTHTLVSKYGCDSVRILHLEVNPLAISDLQVADGCADDGFLAFDLSYTGTAQQVRIRFDEKAHAAGLTDALLPMPADGAISLPFRARAGQYTGSVALLFRTSSTVETPFAFTLLYPSSVLEQAWNDVIAVLTRDYNGGYDFMAFQWYENGQLLSGENRSYLYRPLQMGAEYCALLTETDGTQLMSCALVAAPQTDITLYPTLVSPGQKIHCRVSEPADLMLYDALGSKIAQQALLPGDNSVAAPQTDGIYIIRIHTSASKDDKQYKLFVQ